MTDHLEPPANPLICPQFCLRFNDLDNIGRTGRHYSGFIKLGIQVFNSEKQYERQMGNERDGMKTIVILRGRSARYTFSCFFSVSLLHLVLARTMRVSDFLLSQILLFIFSFVFLCRSFSQSTNRHSSGSSCVCFALLSDKHHSLCDVKLSAALSEIQVTGGS